LLKIIWKRTTYQYWLDINQVPYDSKVTKYVKNNIFCGIDQLKKQTLNLKFIFLI